MSPPQLEDGYTRIANETMEALAKVNLSPYESRVLWFILRRTYGWHKKADLISLSQIVSATGISKAHASRAMHSLVARSIVTRIGNKQIGFQKDCEKWIQKLPVQATETKLPVQATEVASSGTPLDREKLPAKAPQKILKKPLQKKGTSPSERQAFENIQEYLRHKTGMKTGIDSLRRSRPFSDWLAYLDQANNKVGVLIEAFKVWHINAPEEDWKSIGGRMGHLFTLANKDAGYLLRIIWETAAADIAGSHLNFIQGKLRKETHARSKGIDRQLPTEYETPEQFDARTSRE